MHSTDLPTRQGPTGPTNPTGPAGPGRLPLRAGAAALILLTGLAGCGYSSTQVSAASSATAPAAPGALNPTGTASPGTAPAPPNSSAAPDSTATAGSPVNPGGPVDPPVAQASSVPAGAKLVVFDGVSRSGDGQTLYLTATAGGGACGRFDVVVQETPTTVELGLAQLPKGKAVVCPMFVRMVKFPASLATPVGNRQVIDMANGQVVGTGGTISVVQADVPALPGDQNGGNGGNGEPSQTARAFNPVTS